MKNLLFSLPLTFSVLTLSLLNGGKILAELSHTAPSFQETNHKLLAQNPSSSENGQLTFSPPLSQVQEKQVQAIDEKYIPQLEAAAQNYNQSLKEIETLIGIDPPNDEVIKKRNEVIANEMKLRDLAFNRLMDIRSVLTPEQKKSFADSVRKLFDR